MKYVPRVMAIAFVAIGVTTLYSGCTGGGHLRNEPDWSNQGEGPTGGNEDGEDEGNQDDSEEAGNS